VRQDDGREEGLVREIGAQRRHGAVEDGVPGTARAAAGGISSSVSRHATCEKSVSLAITE
jgi:hypothetical protein